MSHAPRFVFDRGREPARAFRRFAASWLLGVLLPGCRSGEVSPKKEQSAQATPQALAPQAPVPATAGPAVTLPTGPQGLPVADQDHQGLARLDTSGKPPEDWPSEVPLYPGAKIQMTMKLERGATLTLETADTRAQVSEYYKTQLASLPPSSIVDMGKNQTLLWSDPRKPLQVTLALSATEGGKTRATLIVTRERAQ
ncbi:MAG: hypothetical protein RL033_874 [Pseudomonadota bacterium]|jgi:hypothetical protein